MLPKVDVSYRKTPEDFCAYEKHRQEQDERTLMILRARRRPGFKIPDWAAAVAVLVLVTAAVWVFRRIILP